MGPYVCAFRLQDVTGEETLYRTKSKPGLQVSSTSACCVAPSMALGFVYDVRTGTSWPRVPSAATTESTVVASDSSCVIVPVSLSQAFVAEVSPFVKELVAKSPVPSSYSSLIWRGPGD